MSPRILGKNQNNENVPVDRYLCLIKEKTSLARVPLKVWTGFSA